MTNNRALTDGNLEKIELSSFFKIAVFTAIFLIITFLIAQIILKFYFYIK